MNTTHLKMKVVEELELFPAESLPDLYRFMHDFRLGLMASTKTASTKTTLSLALPVPNIGTEESVTQLQQMMLAAHDPLFLADLAETQLAFSPIDADWWEPVA